MQLIPFLSQLTRFAPNADLFVVVTPGVLRGVRYLHLHVIAFVGVGDCVIVRDFEQVILLLPTWLQAPQPQMDMHRALQVSAGAMA